MEMEKRSRRNDGDRTLGGTASGLTRELWGTERAPHLVWAVAAADAHEVGGPYLCEQVRREGARRIRLDDVHPRIFRRFVQPAQQLRPAPFRW